VFAPVSWLFGVVFTDRVASRLPMQMHSGYKGLSPTYSCAAARDSHPLPMPGGESLRRANAELAKNTTPIENDCDSKDRKDFFHNSGGEHFPDADEMTLGAL
jgi:hypothetical protein